MGNIKGILSTNINQTGNLTTPGIQYTSPSWKMAGHQGGKAGQYTFTGDLGYNDKGLSAGIGLTNAGKVNRFISDEVNTNLTYNGNQGAALSAKAGLNFNVLKSPMKRAGDTSLIISPYLGMTATGRSLTEGGAYNLNNQYTPDGKPRSLVEAGANLDFKTMLTKNLSLSGQAGLGFSGTGTTAPINGQGTETKIHNPGDYGTDLRIMPTASIGLNYNLDGVGKLLYKKPTHKPKSKDIPNPRF
jgi:hypothetical protein